NYTVTLKDFDPSGIAVLDINFKGRLQTIMIQGNRDANGTILTEPMELFNKTMIITPLIIKPPAGIFSCCPELEVNINVPKPEFKIELSSQETSYRMYKEIPVEITVINEGNLVTFNNAVYVDIDGLRFENGRSYYQLPNLETSQKIIMKLKFPVPPTKLNHKLRAYVKGEKGDITYYNEASMNISLRPSIAVRKSVTEESMLISRKDVESIYSSIDTDSIPGWMAGGEIFVSLGVTNYQDYEIRGIRLRDSLHSQLTTENNSLNWTFDLKPYESKGFNYKLQASRPGKFNLPQAKLTYSEFNMSWDVLSNTSTTDVHGPCIQVFKKPDKPVLEKGEDTSVTITIRNSGDMVSKVKVIDSLSENMTFLSGKLYYEGKLPPKESVVISYNISLKEYGQIDLPVPRVYVNDKDDLGCSEPISSKILVKEPKVQEPQRTITIPATAAPTATPVLTPETTVIPTKRYSWLEGVIPVFMLVLAVIVLFILHRSSK
ncbi:MAG TPA: hypothetical protein VN316_01620, partial [candidate division Zixibacteria bacterium]|nr:hypothetical protein [candidate division Zixibacteria bacterium]